MAVGRALLIPLLRYTPHVGDYYKVFLDYITDMLPDWAEYVDRVYLVDGDMGLDKRLFPDKVKILTPANDKSHWKSAHKALQEIPEEHILLIDQDVTVAGSVIDTWLALSEAGKYVTGFDSSMGGRITPYYTVFKKSILEQIGMENLDFMPGPKRDSFGDMLPHLKKLKVSFWKIRDFRNSIYLQEGKIISDNPYNADFYHIRNGNLGIRLLTLYKYDKPGFEETVRITPQREALRVLAWVVRLSDNKFLVDSFDIVEAMGVSIKDWGNYLEAFKEFHNV